MRHILHADLDAFYTSVEQLDNPELRGKPVVVGGAPEGRGVVAAASYEARRFGVRSAMPMRTALQRCPRAIRILPRFDRYNEVSRRVMDIFHDVTELVEPLSLDEAYLDVTDSVSARRPSAAIAEELRQRVRSELSLTISVGVAASKSVAKIASDLDKPDGLTVVPPGGERDFLAPLSVSKLSGIGPKTAARLARNGVHTIGDLASRSDGWLAERFGRTGPHMRRLAMGRDDRPVQVSRERKSVSAETTLARDTDDPELLLSLVDRLSQQVGGHLEDRDVHGSTVRVKLRLADFTTFTRQTTPQQPVGSRQAVAAAARELLRREMRPGRWFRLVGVGVTGFPPAEDWPRQPRLTGFE
jgi:DNA polymerase-4